MVSTTLQSRSKVFSDEALAFDDVLLVPAYSDILPAHVDLTSNLTRAISLNKFQYFLQQWTLLQNQKWLLHLQAREE